MSEKLKPATRQTWIDIHKQTLSGRYSQANKILVNIDEKLKVNAQRKKALQTAIRSYSQRGNKISTIKVLLTTMVLGSAHKLLIKVLSQETEIPRSRICRVVTKYELWYETLQDHFKQKEDSLRRSKAYIEQQMLTSGKDKVLTQFCSCLDD